MKKRKIKYIILIMLLCGAIIFKLYTKNAEYKANNYQEYLENTSDCLVNYDNHHLEFDMIDSDETIVIFKDEQIDYLAYAALGRSLADNFLMDVVIYDYGLLGIYDTKKLLNNYDNEIYLIAHGNASAYLDKYIEKTKMVFLLSPTTTKAINSDIPIISIRGNLDGINDEKASYELSKKLPKSTMYHVIDKANFSNFTLIDLYKNDNAGLISKEEQIAKTIAIIKSYLND